MLSVEKWSVVHICFYDVRQNLRFSCRAATPQPSILAVIDTNQIYVNVSAANTEQPFKIVIERANAIAVW